MQILTRYVLREFCKVFLIALFVVTVLMLFVGVVMDLLPRGLDGVLILQLLPYLVPEAARTAAQFSVLYASCNVFGRLSANNELLAIRSLGISPLVLLPWVLSLAVLLSLGCVWLYDVGEFWGQNGIRRKVIESVEEVAYRSLRAQNSYSTPLFSVAVKGLDGRKLIQPTLLYHPKGSPDPVSITAESGELRLYPRDMSLSIVCTNGSVSVGKKMTMVFPDTVEQTVPLNDASAEKLSWRDENRSLNMIRSEISREKTRIAQLQQVTWRQAYVQPGSASQEQAQLAAEKERLTFLEVLTYRRWTNGFFCFSYVMLGIPVSILLRQGDHLSNFFACFLPVLLFNYPLHLLTIQMAQAGRIPPWSPWVGNVIMIVVGAWLLRKAV